MLSVSPTTTSTAASPLAELKQLLRLSLPVTVTQLGFMLSGVVDTIMVGHLGATPLGALSLGNTVQWALIMPCTGLLMGVDPLITQAHGRGDSAATRLALERTLLLSLLLSVPATLGVLFTEDLLLLLDQDPELSRLAQEYNVWHITAVPSLLLFAALRHYLQGRGIMAPAAWVMVIDNVLNVIANWALIWGHLGAPALGLRGAAIATGITAMLMPLMLYFLASQLSLIEPRPASPSGAGRFFQPQALSPAGLRQILALGAPVAAHMALEHGAFAGSAVIAGWVSTAAVSGHHITLNVAALAFMVPLGISMGAATRVGNLIGSGDLTAMRRAMWLSLSLGGLVMTGSALLFVFARRAIAELYTEDSQIIALVVGTLPIVAAFQLADGVQCVAAGILRGMGRPRPGALVNLLCYYVLGLPIAYELAFNQRLGLRGIWAALAIGVWLAAALLVTWAVRTSRKGLAEMSHHVHES